jgi:hypothetical protein
MLGTPRVIAADLATIVVGNQLELDRLLTINGVNSGAGRTLDPSTIVHCTCLQSGFK